VWALEGHYQPGVEGEWVKAAASARDERAKVMESSMLDMARGTITYVLTHGLTHHCGTAKPAPGEGFAGQARGGGGGGGASHAWSDAGVTVFLAQHPQSQRLSSTPITWPWPASAHVCFLSLFVSPS
jgi:hypothetical protein